MNKLLEVKNLKKYFPTESGKLHAVDDVSFSLEQGKTLGVVGESGCGKSTLARVIVHLLEATGGHVFFEGKNVTNPNKRQMHTLRQNMQMVFQDPYASINPRMSVSEIIGEPLKIYHISKNRKDYTTRVNEIMDKVGLASRLANSYPHELDGGRRQRVGIGRALALKPKFIACDEPVSALDVSIQAQILNLLKELQKHFQVAYIFITHDLSVVRHISNDIAVMYMGTLVEKSDSKELFRSNLHPYTKALLSAIPRPKIGANKERILLRGEISSPIEPAEMCRFAPRCEYAIKKCFYVKPLLEELLPNHFVACHRAREVNNLHGVPTFSIEI
ncbi:MAG TPA: ATP-binding cassette domain-containing protein [Synergistales bacterium]|nr:ATP-binding cassette domain-containing protein [Synergistales bacterium]